MFTPPAHRPSTPLFLFSSIYNWYSWIGVVTNSCTNQSINMSEQNRQQCFLFAPFSSLFLHFLLRSIPSLHTNTVSTSGLLLLCWSFRELAVAVAVDAVAAAAAIVEFEPTAVRLLAFRPLFPKSLRGLSSAATLFFFASVFCVLCNRICGLCWNSLVFEPLPKWLLLESWSPHESKFDSQEG